MKKIQRYAKLFSTCFKCSLMNSLEYKFNFFFGGLFELAWMFMYIIFFSSIYMNTSSIAGWSRNEALMLVVFCGWVDAVFTFFVNAGIADIPGLVNQGTMDFVLLKPVNKQYYLSIRKTTIPQIFNIIINIAIFTYLINISNIEISAGKVFMFLMLALNALFIIYCFIFIVMSLSFWVIKMDIIFGLLPESITIGNKPFDIYPNLIKKVFTYIIPLAISYNFPVLYLVRGLNAYQIAIAFFLSIVFFLLSRMVFKLGLKKYSSASS